MLNLRRIVVGLAFGLSLTPLQTAWAERFERFGPLNPPPGLYSGTPAVQAATPSQRPRGFAALALPDLPMVWSDKVLRYVQFDAEALRNAYRARIDAAGLDRARSAEYLKTLFAGLEGYTYLED